ncbi:MAG: DUF1439 domain-containing protein [Verrucomicrobiaceae bacterium]
MKLFRIILAIAAIGLLLGGWTIWQKLQSKDGILLTFTEAELEAKLGEEFPRTELIQGILPLTIDTPDVELVPNSDRVRVSLGANVNAFIAQYDATATISCAIRYEPSDQSLRFNKAIIEKFDTEKLPEKYREEVSLAATLLIQKYLNDQPVYHLKDEDLKGQTARLLVQEIGVKDGLLQIRLGL